MIFNFLRLIQSTEKQVSYSTYDQLTSLLSALRWFPPVEESTTTNRVMKWQCLRIDRSRSLLSVHVFHHHSLELDQPCSFEHVDSDYTINTLILAQGRLLSGSASKNNYPRPPSPSPHLDQQQDLRDHQQSTPLKMGTWGSGLYQSDIDLDTLDLIAEEAVKMMSDPECLRSAMVPEFFTLRAPIDRTATVQQLEDGVLNRMIRRFSHQKNHGAIVILGMVCMELGARFNPEDMLSLKMALMRWDANKTKKDQVCLAYESYHNNGAVWRFDGMKGVELAVSPQEKGAEAKGGDVPDVTCGTDIEDGMNTPD